MVVELIHQGDEPFRLFSVLVFHDWDITQKYRVENLADGNIICCSKCLNECMIRIDDGAAYTLADTKSCMLGTCLHKSLKEKKTTPLSALGTISLRPPTFNVVDLAIPRLEEWS